MAFNPSGEEQEVLELMNRMRQNPAAELDLLLADADAQSAISYFGINSSLLRNQWSTLQPTTPLAWSPNLYQIATEHSQAMIQTDQQAHNLPGGPTFSDRLKQINYQGAAAENIFAYTKNPLYGHAGMAIDWGTTSTGIQEPPGHRDNLMNSSMQEIGIAVVPDNNPSTKVGPWVMTQDFGSVRSDAGAWLLGVVYDDQDRDGFYDSGEGVGNVTVTAVGDTGSFTATSWTAGGYQLQVPAGSYTVTFSGGNLPDPVEKMAAVADDNVKLDLTLTIAPEKPDLPDPNIQEPPNILLPPPPPPPVVVRHQLPQPNNRDRGPQTGIQPGFNGPYFDYTDNDDQISLATKPQGTAIVRGLSGHDVIQGSGDRDDVNGNAGMDTIRGGAGNDDVLRGGKGSDFIDGETGDDAVNGNNDNDTVWGGVGDDWVRGGKDDDVLLGNAGNDRLVGDLGQDWLTGGEGNDVFALRCDAPAVAASVDLADVVLDFQTGDQIGLNDGKTFADLTLESISLSIDNISVDSTAIRLANGSYIGVIQGVLPSALPASVFMDATSFA